MKTLFLIPMMAVLLPRGVNAQHCPFDGSSMIAIHVTDKEGKNLARQVPIFFLQEIENPLADSCAYAQGLIKIPFERAEAAFKRHTGSWESWSRERSKGCSFLEPGHYVVVLNMSQIDCMIKEGSAYKYTKRRFEIRWTDKTGTKSASVPIDKIYHLCTNGGSWKRIEAITLQVRN